MNRDDFSAKTKIVIGQRAAYTCCNPECGKSTAGPHSDPERAVLTGVAAHICAAAAGGPVLIPCSPLKNAKVRLTVYGYVTRVVT